jgi:hypothetical protein
MLTRNGYYKRVSVLTSNMVTNDLFDHSFSMCSWLVNCSQDLRREVMKLFCCVAHAITFGIMMQLRGTCDGKQLLAHVKISFL